jgi:hypothetical protein
MIAPTTAAVSKGISDGAPEPEEKAIQGTPDRRLITIVFLPHKKALGVANQSTAVFA